MILMRMFWRLHGCPHRYDDHLHVEVQSSPWGADGFIRKCRKCPCVKAT